MAKLQTKGNAEAERLREAIPTGGCGSDSRSRVANPNYPGSMLRMGGLRARVQNGCLVVDEPTTLPEGTVLDLVVDDEGDDLDAAERTLRDEAIEKAWQQAQAGQGRPAEDLVCDLRRR